MRVMTLRALSMSPYEKGQRPRVPGLRHHVAQIYVVLEKENSCVRVPGLAGRHTASEVATAVFAEAHSAVGQR